MMAALALSWDEIQGEVCSECLDLRKDFNAADRPHLSLEMRQPVGFAPKHALPVLLRSLYSYGRQLSRSA